MAKGKGKKSGKLKETDIVDANFDAEEINLVWTTRKHKLLPSEGNKTKPSDGKQTKTSNLSEPSGHITDTRQILLKEPQGKGVNNNATVCIRSKESKGTKAANKFQKSVGEDENDMIIGNDVLIDVDPNDDQFDADEGRLGTDSELPLGDEELDYDFTGLDDEVEVELTVEEEVTFKTPEQAVTTPRSTKRKDSVEMIHPDDLEGYVQRLVDSRWKQKEEELLRKHRLSVGSNSGKDGCSNNEKVKSPSDTTIYAPALHRAQKRNFGVVNRLFNLRESDPI